MYDQLRSFHTSFRCGSSSPKLQKIRLMNNQKIKWLLPSPGSTSHEMPIIPSSNECPSLHLPIYRYLILPFIVPTAPFRTSSNLGLPPILESTVARITARSPT